MTTLPLGRLAPHPEETHPRLKLGAFLDHAALPPVPAQIDYISRVADWPTYLNQEIGDCTCAAAGHIIEAATCYGQGRTVEISDQDVLKAYEAVSGYRPGDPSTDNGAVMQDVLNYWRRVGIGGHKILAFAQVDHTNLAEVKAALYLFGHLYVGCTISQAAMDQFNAGQPWSEPADNGGILGGHAINLGTPDKVVTWGRVQQFDQGWWNANVEESWIVITPEWVSATGGTPEGLDVASVNAAFTELTGQAGPFPGPQPSPTPTPVPPGPTPGPAPDGDPADVALVNALAAIGRHGWLAEHHAGDNRHAAQAVTAWKTAKGL